MSAQLLLQEFDKVADTPDAISQLRTLILEFALSGKFSDVKGDCQTGDIAVRRERIYSGMKSLLEGRPRYRWRSAGQPIEEVEKMPAGWCAVTLDDTGLYVNGLPFGANEWGTTGRPIIRIQNLSGFSSTFNYAHGEFDADNVAEPGDLLVSWSATLDTYIWPGPEGLVNQHIFKVVPNREAVTREFLFWLLKHEVRKLARSQHAHGIAMLHINRGPFLGHVVLLPPLDEQERIVGTITELMGLCDRLEEAQSERDSLRSVLRTASLRRVTDARQEKARRHDTYFFLDMTPRLIAKPGDLPEVRHAIRKLALQGRLVPQDESDEDASRLLGDRALSNGDLQDLPQGWCWTTLGSIGEILGGGTPSKSRDDFWNGSIPWVTPKDMKKDFIADSRDHITATAVSNSSVKMIPVGSILMVVRGMILAHSFPTAITTGAVTVNQDMKVLVPFDGRLREMLLLITRGMRDSFLGLVERSTHGTGRLPTGELLNLPIPMPPVAEQARIVAKVNDLLAVCDQLEEEFATTQAGRAELLDSLIGNSLNEG